MIKVKELIKMLGKVNPELNVMMSADEEGNYFLPLFSVETYQLDLDDPNCEPSVIFFPE